MARISIKGAGARSWELGDTPLTVGRRPDNDIVVNDGYASGRHALIGRDEAGCYVEDLKSSNGTLVNGRRIERSALHHGDLVRIGTAEFSFEDEERMDRTLILSAPAEQAASVPTAAPAAAPAAVAASAAAAAGGADTGMAATGSLLEDLVGSIRSHRDREQQEREAANQRVRAEWERLVVLADEIRSKTAQDARVRRFVVDRRSQDVTIQLQRRVGAPLMFISVSLHHPDHRHQQLSGLWLRRTGEADRCLPTAQAAATELVRDLAFLLA